MPQLYPRPWRPTRLEVAWRTWRDLHPEPMPGYTLLPVGRLPWWQRFIWFHRSPGLTVGGVNLLVGALVFCWKRWRFV